jgi:hypothetical protein
MTQSIECGRVEQHFCGQTMLKIFKEAVNPMKLASKQGVV